MSYPSQGPNLRYGLPSVVVNAGNETPTDASGSPVLVSLAPGSVTVSLAGVPVNCTPASPFPVHVAIASGDTTDVAFTLVCRDVNQLLVWSPGGATYPSIALVDADGERFHEVFPATALIGAVGWSPDARRIAFVYEGTPGASQQAVWTVRPDGTGLGSLWAPPDGVTQPIGITWSPDGSQLAITSGSLMGHSGGPTSLHLVSADGTRDILVANLLGVPVQYRHLTWSPDGEKLAVIVLVDPLGLEQRVELHTLNGDGSGEVVVPMDGAGKIEWSPVGDRLALLDGRGVHTIRPDGTDPVPVRDGVAFDVDWSPDGSRLAIAADDGVRVINADGRGDVLVRSKGEEFAPEAVDWSPVNDQIAYVTAMLVDDPLINIRYTTGVVSLDGSGLPALVSDQYRVLAVWRP